MPFGSEFQNTDIPQFTMGLFPGKPMKKAKWLSGEVLQIAMKRREVKSKG